MPRLHVIVFASLLSAVATATDPTCVAVRLPEVAEVGKGVFTLSDLLPPDTCASIRIAASQVELGQAPLPGSERTFTGDELTARMRRLDAAIASKVLVPRRIVVGRKAERWSCPAIEDRLAELLPSLAPAGGVSRRLQCDSAQRIPRGALLRLVRTFRDPASGRRTFLLRCARTRDCVPFLVRAQAEDSVSRVEDDPVSARLVPVMGERRPESAPVRAGQAATLIWEQPPFRARLEVICLDRGDIGDHVRVRVKGTGKVMNAIVESAGKLRADL